MRIISQKLLRDFIHDHSTAEVSLKDWIKKTEKADWNHFPDVRQTFNAVDQLSLPSTKAGVDEKGRRRIKTLVTFNIGGNDYRLIASINYKTKIVYTLFVLTHAEYNKNDWKKQL